MTDDKFYECLEIKELPLNKEYYEELNRRADEMGCGYLKVIIRDGYVYKDELHALLGIGIKLQD